jgi:hypothetical protein
MFTIAHPEARDPNGGLSLRVTLVLLNFSARRRSGLRRNNLEKIASVMNRSAILIRCAGIDVDWLLADVTDWGNTALRCSSGLITPLHVLIRGNIGLSLGGRCQ